MKAPSNNTALRALKALSHIALLDMLIIISLWAADGYGYQKLEITIVQWFVVLFFLFALSSLPRYRFFINDGVAFPVVTIPRAILEMLIMLTLIYILLAKDADVQVFSLKYLSVAWVFGNWIGIIISGFSLRPSNNG